MLVGDSWPFNTANKVIKDIGITIGGFFGRVQVRKNEQTMDAINRLLSDLHRANTPFVRHSYCLSLMFPNLVYLETNAFLGLEAFDNFVHLLTVEEHEDWLLHNQGLSKTSRQWTPTLGCSVLCLSRAVSGQLLIRWINYCLVKLTTDWLNKLLI